MWEKRSFRQLVWNTRIVITIILCRIIQEWNGYPKDKKRLYNLYKAIDHEWIKWALFSLSCGRWWLTYFGAWLTEVIMDIWCLKIRPSKRRNCRPAKWAAGGPPRHSPATVVTAAIVSIKIARPRFPRLAGNGLVETCLSRYCLSYNAFCSSGVRFLL